MDAQNNCVTQDELAVSVTKLWGNPIIEVVQSVRCFRCSFVYTNKQHSMGSWQFLRAAGTGIFSINSCGRDDPLACRRGDVNSKLTLMLISTCLVLSAVVQLLVNLYVN